MKKEERDVSKLVKHLVEKEGWDQREATSQAKWTWNVLYTMRRHDN